ncbi:chorismate mutase [Pseudomonas canadensis]|uniref:chorismate mutase n=1 Tax=Pseudomonas canadensis TaxID=915099 RepID=UPI0030D056BB
MVVNCKTLEEVRINIDRLDQQIVALLAERGRYVSQAAGFKKDTDGVRAPQRVEQVIAKVREISQETGANPDVTEQVYRAMIAAFIQQELEEHAVLKSPGNPSSIHTNL